MCIHNPDPDQHHNKCSATSLDYVCLVARTEMLLVKGGLVVVVRRKLVSVETRMVGRELNIFSNNLWRIYPYQLAD